MRVAAKDAVERIGTGPVVVIAQELDKARTEGNGESHGIEGIVGFTFNQGFCESSCGGVIESAQPHVPEVLDEVLAVILKFVTLSLARILVMVEVGIHGRVTGLVLAFDWRAGTLQVLYDVEYGQVRFVLKFLGLVFKFISRGEEA